jgi:hypothetical protein
VCVTLVAQHAKRVFSALYCMIICGLSGLQYFLHHLINGTILGKKVTEPKIRVLIFSTTLSETFLNLTRTQQNIIINSLRSLMKLESYLQILEKL